MSKVPPVHQDLHSITTKCCVGRKICQQGKRGSWKQGDVRSAHLSGTSAERLRCASNNTGKNIPPLMMMRQETRKSSSFRCFSTFLMLRNFLHESLVHCWCSLKFSALFIFGLHHSGSVGLLDCVCSLGAPSGTDSHTHTHAQFEVVTSQQNSPSEGITGAVGNLCTVLRFTVVPSRKEAC